MRVDERSTASTSTNQGSDRGPIESIERLPYGPRFNAALPALYRGFLVVNRAIAAPALRAGLGPLFATPLNGSMMLLRTRGRTSGLQREAPLGYVIHAGAIYCVAGFGARTHWYRNILADPRVECVLPTVAIAGTAEVVTDPVEWTPAYRALIKGLGVIGRLTVGDVAHQSEEKLDAQRASLPLVRITPTGIAPGPFDPGGLGWIPGLAISTWATLRLLGLLRRGLRHRA